MTQVMPEPLTALQLAQKSHDIAATCCEQAALAHKQASKCYTLEDLKSAQQHAKMAQLYIRQALEQVGLEQYKLEQTIQGQEKLDLEVLAQKADIIRQQPSAPVPTLQQF